MVGFPPHLNTKHDYQYIRKHFLDREWRPHWQALLDQKDAWLMGRRLAAKEPGRTGGTHRVVKVETADGRVERYQQEFKEDPHALIFRIGLGVGEVTAGLAQDRK